MVKLTQAQKTRDRLILLSELRLQITYLNQIISRKHKRYGQDEISNARELIDKLESFA